MPRRAKPLRFPVPRGAVRFFAPNLAVGVLLGGWFVAQPASRQREVRRLVENALEHNKRVTALMSRGIFGNLLRRQRDRAHRQWREDAV